MEAGAPQGSAINPTLYNLLVYDIPQPADKSVGIAQFADDTCLWVISPEVGVGELQISEQTTTNLHRLDKDVENEQDPDNAHKEQEQTQTCHRSYPVKIDNTVHIFSFRNPSNTLA